MPRRSGPFYVFEIAQELARQPGRLEFDWDEAHRIGADMYDRYERGEFAEDEVVVQFGQPLRFGTLREAEEEAKRGGGEWDDMYPSLWYAAVALTESAAERYIKGCALQGASRLIREWFGERAKQRKRGPKPELRDRIAQKMLDDLRSGRRSKEELQSDTLAALSKEYGGSQNTAGDARDVALSKFSEFQGFNC